MSNLFQVDKNICLQDIFGMHSVESKFHSKQNSLFSSPLLRINHKSYQQYFMIQTSTWQGLIQILQQKEICSKTQPHPTFTLPSY